MRRRALLVAVLVVAVMVGWLVVPRVISSTAPTRTEPTRTEPTRTEPTRTEPTRTQPTRTEPSAMIERTTPSATVTALATPDPSPSPEPSLSEGELADLAAGVLGHEVPPSAGGTFEVLLGSEPAPAEDSAAAVMTVRIEVEAGVPIDVAAFGAFVMVTLNDPRGWGSDGSVTFARTDGTADVRVVVASPATVDRMCAPLRTVAQYSCGRNGAAALNAIRWVDGAAAYLGGGGDLTSYRQYLITHEVGHLLGHPHTHCPATGAVAPVMLQQSITIGGCLPNAWVAP